jgi:hypothetical protein
VIQSVLVSRHDKTTARRETVASAYGSHLALYEGATATEGEATRLLGQRIRPHYSLDGAATEDAMTAPITPERMPEWIERMTMPEPNSGCWLWLGSLNTKGYGKADLRLINHVRSTLAHRLIYFFFKGVTDQQLDHLCRTHSCVNPAHLEPVTNSVNHIRGRMSRGLWGTCDKGHPFTPENTKDRSTPTKLKRWCRTCIRAYFRVYEKQHPRKRTKKKSA